MFRKLYYPLTAMLFLSCEAHAGTTNVPIILDANATAEYVNDGSDTNRYSPGARQFNPTVKRAGARTIIQQPSVTQAGTAPTSFGTIGNASPNIATPANFPNGFSSAVPSVSKIVTDRPIIPKSVQDMPSNATSGSSISELDVITPEAPPPQPATSTPKDSYGLSPLNGQ